LPRRLSFRQRRCAGIAAGSRIRNIVLAVEGRAVIGAATAPGATGTAAGCVRLGVPNRGLPMSSDLGKRIDAMFARDTAAAALFVLALWIVIGFVFAGIGGVAGPAVATVLLAAGGLVVIFNTASIAAMIRHYRHEKARIYGLDIEHLDALAADRRGEPAGVLADDVSGAH
jgi:hypothetical protein